MPRAGCRAAVCGAARAGGTNQLCPPGLGVSVPPACPERGKRDRHLSLIILTPDRCFMFDNIAIIKFMWPPLTKPVCSGLLGWISPRAPWHGPTSSPASPAALSHPDGQTCPFSLFVRLFPSFISPFPTLTTRWIQPDRGTWTERRCCSKEPFKLGGNREKSFLKVPELCANNNTALTKHRVRWTRA